MPWTRKQLEKHFHVEDRTVRKTLTAIGLNIKDKEYSDEDFERFKEARELIENGVSYEELRQHFGGESFDDENGNGVEGNGSFLDDLATETIGGIFDDALDQLIEGDIIPKLFLKKLYERKSQIKASFKRVQNQLEPDNNSRQNGHGSLDGEVIDTDASEV